ncbi:glycosyltransferase family 2 protein [Vibrio sp. 2-2(8)]|uniref:glycosyltransferase family 2 protein n=1 Tax=Vibrio sp. 2-2(8) TaxID=2591014 RepID=UPI001481D990|nr:glycosyltransferase family 2 protein [Vibrio sp. 2-2(8)]NNN48621.1 glycosyltransferase [Vibrio sp. 2-2(8)]
MKISIITVTYNAEETIERTLNSVVKQDYNNIEFIFVDGSSTDRTLEIVKDYMGAIDKFVSEPDNGIYDAMNKGIDLATGDVLHFLNSDDYYCDSETISRVMSCFTEDIDIVSSPVTMVDSKERYLYDFKPLPENPFKCIPHQGFYYRAVLHKDKGKYSSYLRYASDYDFYLSVRESNKIKVISQPTVFMQNEGRGVSDGFFVLSELFYVQIKHGLSYGRAFRRFIFLLAKNRVRLFLEKPLLRYLLDRVRYGIR